MEIFVFLMPSYPKRMKISTYARKIQIIKCFFLFLKLQFRTYAPI